MSDQSYFSYISEVIIVELAKEERIDVIWSVRLSHLPGPCCHLFLGPLQMQFRLGPFEAQWRTEWGTMTVALAVKKTITHLRKGKYEKYI